MFFYVFLLFLLVSWSATLQSISPIRVKYRRYLVCGHIEYLEHTYVLCLAFIGHKTPSVSSFLDFCALCCSVLPCALHLLCTLYTDHVSARTIFNYEYNCHVREPHLPFVGID